MHAIMILFKQNLEQEVLNIPPKRLHKRHKNCQHVMISISTTNNKLKIILVSMIMQEGGFEKLQLDKAPSISSTVPMEAVVFKAEQSVVHPKG